MNNAYKGTLEVESELFSLVNSILKMNSKYKKGVINHNFYQKALKNTMNNLLQINFFLKENNLILSDILKNMKMTDKYYKAIDIINEASKIKFSTDNNYPSSILELPAVISEITSSFITLMDALKLEFKNRELISELFDELIIHLQKFPGLDLLVSKVKNIFNKIEKNLNILGNTKLREKIGNDLYLIFQEFQKKLDLKR